MNCSECVTVLQCADLRASDRTDAETAVPGTQEAVSHAETCDRCWHAFYVIRAGTDSLRRTIDAALPARPAEVIIASAWRRRRHARWLTLAAAAGAVGAIVVLVQVVRIVVIPEVRRLLEPPPVLETRTFAVACISAEQAATALQPFLPTPRNPRWEAEWFDVRPTAPGVASVTVRAMSSFLDSVPQILRQIERDANGRCRTAPTGAIRAP